MINFNSLFRFTTSQKRGVLFLISIILLLQLIYYFVDFSNKKTNVTSEELVLLQQKIDSLKEIKSKEIQPKIYPFNPNYITDFKGYQLGMSPQEIDNLLNFRKSGKYVNSAEEFQRITGVNDSLLSVLKPYFKFPEWTKFSKVKNLNTTKSNQSILVKRDINVASIEDFKNIKGIGDVLSKRIVSYRNKLTGFSFNNQLFEIYNIDSLVVINILNQFEVKQLPKIKKININSATFKEILAVPYIDYELTKKIINYKRNAVVIQSLDELKNIDQFPLEKFDRIALYLQAN